MWYLEDAIGKITDRIAAPAALLSFVASFQDNIEWSLRILILLLGVGFAALRLYRFWKKGE